jgi:hypothetical protein
MGTPRVEITIAVHSEIRPIARAVASVVKGTTAEVRVNVVAHNIDPDIIERNLGSFSTHPAVRLLALCDGIHSPAGPMNLGLGYSTAQFVGVLGSDDEFEAGAIDSWLRLQERSGAAMVLARIQHANGGVVPSPPTRPFRQQRLDPVKDRLSYRSAPLGIVSRERFPDLRFTEGLVSGEDLPYVSRLWFSGERLAFDRKGPAYLVHDDASDRVTSGPRLIDEDFGFLDHILGQDDFDSLDISHRRALAVKLIRSHVFDAVVNRAGAGQWAAGERERLAAVTIRVLGWAKETERYLSRLDRLVLDSVLDTESSLDSTMALIRQRWRYTSTRVLVPRNPLYVLARQAPLRTYIGGYFV